MPIAQSATRIGCLIGCSRPDFIGATQGQADAKSGRQGQRRQVFNPGPCRACLRASEEPVRAVHPHHRLGPCRSEGQPRLRFASIEELDGWLEAECLRWAALHPHPEQKELTVAEALDLERPTLQPMLAPFDGFHETAHAVTGTCLISFDRNRYSVMAKAARRAVQVRAYADRIVVRLGNEVIAEHARHFGRDRTIYDPWHYLPVLANKPSAWRNGAPFHGWDLPPALTRLRRKLGSGDEADRRFVRVLAAVLTDGLEAVEAAIREALDAGAASDEVILNIVARYREPATDRPLDLVVDLKLNHPPIADCARYDTVRGLDAAA